jgi:hypothetical protein
MAEHIGTQSTDKEPPAVGQCGNWYAWHDFMPGRTPTLRVTGQCTFGTPGFIVTLTKASPQGINPKILILDKSVTPPTGVVTQVVTTVDVRYEEETSTKYDQVHIRPDNAFVDVVITS